MRWVVVREMREIPGKRITNIIHLLSLFLIPFAAAAAEIDDVGAAAVVRKDFRGKRKTNKIVVENYSNKALVCQEDSKIGLLPPSSREVTPVQEVAPVTVDPADGEEICFVSGNPFVEVTKGVIHLFKKK